MCLTPYVDEPHTTASHPPVSTPNKDTILYTADSRFFSPIKYRFLRLFWNAGHSPLTPLMPRSQTSLPTNAYQCSHFVAQDSSNERVFQIHDMEILAVDKTEPPSPRNMETLRRYATYVRLKQPRIIRHNNKSLQNVESSVKTSTRTTL